MPCPFGYAAAEEDDVEDESCSEAEDEGGETTKGAACKATSAADDAVAKEKPLGKPKTEAQKDKDRFDYDKDPISWFYQHQIKSEEDFQAKKNMLREEAKRRLDDIMKSKKQLVDLGSDSEWDELSIRSSELSDLDSDLDSLSSLRSCAKSWIEDAKYPTHAENFVKYGAQAFVVVAAFCILQSYWAMDATRKVQGVVINQWWPTLTFLAALVNAALLGVNYMAAKKRSKRYLLAALVGFVAVYSCSITLVLGMFFKPTSVDTRLKDVACKRYTEADSAARLCNMLPDVERQLASSMSFLKWSAALMAVCSVVLCGAGVWYVFELAYIEKRAMKHKRRHKRRKHTIPWEKIKVIGPVTNCGASAPQQGHGHGGARAAPSAAGGKCPFGYKDKEA